MAKIITAAICDSGGHGATSRRSSAGSECCRNRPGSKRTIATAQHQRPRSTQRQHGWRRHSGKTGAGARAGIAYAARFQAYIDDLETNHGARVLFMGGIVRLMFDFREHPRGKASDVCQLRHGAVDQRAICPAVRCSARSPLQTVGSKRTRCNSDDGHAQIGVTAPLRRSPCRIGQSKVAQAGERPRCSAESEQTEWWLSIARFLGRPGPATCADLGFRGFEFL